MEEKESLDSGHPVDLVIDIHDRKSTSQTSRNEDQSKNGSEGQQLSGYTGESHLSWKRKEQHPSHETDEDSVTPDLKEEPVEAENSQSDDDAEYITGVKSTVILMAVTGACFILLLDISIIATVSLEYHLDIDIQSNSVFHRQFLA